MAQMKCLHKLFDFKILTTCFLTITLSVTEAARAEYQPPRDQKPPSGYTDSSGVRGGCSRTGTGELTILAPVTHVGQSTSTHSTFAWFVPDYQSTPIEFSLYEFDTNNQPNKIAYKHQLRSLPGIMKLSLPQNLSGLAVGKRYLWQVEILCNPNHPSRNPLKSAEIEVVKMPPTLKSALSVTQDHSQKAFIYAKAGMWYDALAEALASTANAQMGKVAASLLEDLSKLEPPQQRRDLNNIAMSDRL